MFNRALEIKPDEYVSLRSKGVSFSNLERYEEAIEYFDGTLKIKPDDYVSLKIKPLYCVFYNIIIN